MDYRIAAPLIWILATAPAALARTEADPELCAIVEARPDKGICQVRLLNAAAAEELPGVVARACSPGTQLTVEIPSSGLYEHLVSILCQSSPMRDGPTMFTCETQGATLGERHRPSKSGAALEHNPMLDHHAALGP